MSLTAYALYIVMHVAFEIRAMHLALRAFFAFDPKRAAILLIGGDKHGRRGFYEKLIRRADDLYREHLRTLKK